MLASRNTMQMHDAAAVSLCVQTHAKPESKKGAGRAAIEFIYYSSLASLSGFSLLETAAAVDEI